MNTMRHQHRSAPAARRPAFTIAEMVVAIAVIALLTVAIGEIFRSVGRLTTLGGAVAETDSLARNIERRLRADFEALNRLPPEETFLIIRMREVGDLDRNQSVGGDGELGLYLTLDDLLADRDDGVNPYQSIAGSERRSRAVTRRIDEIAFLGRARDDEPYRTSQIDPDGEVPSVTARHARIYWGHALRPAPDPNFNPTNPLQSPPRLFHPDGLDGANQPFSAWGEAFGRARSNGEVSRNQFAGDWILARHQLLLYGGRAAGDLGATVNDSHPIGARRSYAPYIRDLETNTNSRFPAGVVGQPHTPPGAGQYPNPTFPYPRYIRHGRVDICAQDLHDVRRWLEGEPNVAGLPGTPPIPFAGAYSAGRFSGLNALVSGSPTPNSGLWTRAFISGSPFNTIRDNVVFARSAIAGTLTRILQDDTVAPIERGAVPGAVIPPAHERLMDLHAAVAMHCSNFEVAWSDGTRAAQRFTRGQRVFNPGDIIWFDISPIEDPPPGAVQRSTYREWWEWHETAFPGTPGIDFRSGSPTAPILPERPDFPEVLFSQMGDPNFMNAGTDEARYSFAFTGGPGNFENEAMAVWGFRVPDAEGGYSRPWPKPKFIRIRMTLHDSQMRLREGRTYEFVFAVHPDSGV